MSRLTSACYIAALLTSSVVLALVGWVWFKILTGDLRTFAVITVAAPATIIGAALLYGLIRRRCWGRWLGLAVCSAGMVTLLSVSWYTWSPLLLFLVPLFGVLALSLLGRSVTARYELAQLRRVQLLGWSVVLAMGGVPFLWLGAVSGVLHQWPGHRLGIALAVLLLVVGAALLLRRRSAGVLMVALGGLLALADSALLWHETRGCTGEIGAWICGLSGRDALLLLLSSMPTGLGALLAAGICARPAWRYLHGVGEEPAP